MSIFKKYFIPIIICLFSTLVLSANNAEKEIEFSKLVPSVEEIGGKIGTLKGTWDDMYKIALKMDSGKLRAPAISLMRKYLNEKDAKPLFLMEKDGGEWSSYNAYFVTTKGVLFIEHKWVKDNPEGKWNTRNLDVTNEEALNLYSRIKKCEKYIGDASLASSSISAYFTTIWDEEKVLDTIAVASMTSGEFKNKFEKNEQEMELYNVYYHLFYLTKKK